MAAGDVDSVDTNFAVIAAGFASVFLTLLKVAATVVVASEKVLADVSSAGKSSITSHGIEFGCGGGGGGFCCGRGGLTCDTDDGLSSFGGGGGFSFGRGCFTCDTADGLLGGGGGFSFGRGGLNCCAATGGGFPAGKGGLTCTRVLG